MLRPAHLMWQAAITVVVAATMLTSALAAELKPLVDLTSLEGHSLGPRRAGLACLPNGAMRRDDVSFSDDAQLDAMLIYLLAERKLDTVALQGRSRPIAVVTDFSVKACAKLFLSGRANMLTGEGSISVRWQISDGKPDGIVTASRFSFTKARGQSGDIITTALRAAVDDLGTAMARSTE